MLHASLHGPTHGMSIGSAIFAGLTSVTDRQTTLRDRLVTIGHIYDARSTAMPPNNNLHICDAVVVTAAIAIVQPVHLIKRTQRQVTANPYSKPTDL